MQDWRDAVNQKSRNSYLKIVELTLMILACLYYSNNDMVKCYLIYLSEAPDELRTHVSVIQPQCFAEMKTTGVSDFRIIADAVCQVELGI